MPSFQANNKNKNLPLFLFFLVRLSQHLQDWQALLCLCCCPLVQCYVCHLSSNHVPQPEDLDTSNQKNNNLQELLLSKEYGGRGVQVGVGTGKKGKTYKVSSIAEPIHKCTASMQ